MFVCVESLSRHDISDTPAKEPSSMNKTFTVDDHSHSNSDYTELDDLEPLNISGSGTCKLCIKITELYYIILK